MKIHFCDLCNESVPQGDLDLGRAALVKGRVVCQKCNELMHAGLQAPAGGSALAPPPGATSAAAGAAGAAHHPGAHVQHARQRSSGAGTAMALIAWIGVAGVGFWLYDRSEQEKRHIEARFEYQREWAAGQRDQLQALISEQENRRGAERQATSERLAEQRNQLTAALAEQGKQAREIEERLSGFDQRLAGLQQSLGGVQRHDKELLALQQKYSTLSDELADLGRVMGDLADEAARVAAAPAAAGAASTEPAWSGLIAALASPDDGDRWQAVIALGETRDPAVAEYIVPVLADSDIFVRMAAARILGDLGSPVGIPALIDALADPEPSVREAVYSALKAVTKRDLPFDALSENADERQKRIKAWRDWWAKEQPQAGG